MMINSDVLKNVLGSCEGPSLRRALQLVSQIKRNLETRARLMEMKLERLAYAPGYVGNGKFRMKHQQHIILMVELSDLDVEIHALGQVIAKHQRRINPQAERQGVA